MSDYIKREDAITLFEKICDYKKCANVRGGMWCEICAIGLPMSELRNKPAEDVAPVVHAKWEKIDSNTRVCSACGFGFDIGCSPILVIANYCPSCGAKMDAR